MAAPAPSRMSFFDAATGTFDRAGFDAAYAAYQRDRGMLTGTVQGGGAINPIAVTKGSTASTSTASAKPEDSVDKFRNAVKEITPTWDGTDAQAAKMYDSHPRMRQMFPTLDDYKSYLQGYQDHLGKQDAAYESFKEGIDSLTAEDVTSTPADPNFNWQTDYTGPQGIDAISEALAGINVPDAYSMEAAFGAGLGTGVAGGQTYQSFLEEQGIADQVGQIREGSDAYVWNGITFEKRDVGESNFGKVLRAAIAMGGAVALGPAFQTALGPALSSIGITSSAAVTGISAGLSSAIVNGAMTGNIDLQEAFTTGIVSAATAGLFDAVGNVDLGVDVDGTVRKVSDAVADFTESMSTGVSFVDAATSAIGQSAITQLVQTGDIDVNQLAVSGALASAGEIWDFVSGGNKPIDEATQADWDRVLEGMSAEVQAGVGQAIADKIQPGLDAALENQGIQAFLNSWNNTILPNIRQDASVTMDVDPLANATEAGVDAGVITRPTPSSPVINFQDQNTARILESATPLAQNPDGSFVDTGEPVKDQYGYYLVEGEDGVYITNGTEIAKYRGNNYRAGDIETRYLNAYGSDLTEMYNEQPFIWQHVHGGGEQIGLAENTTEFNSITASVDAFQNAEDPLATSADMAALRDTLVNVAEPAQTDINFEFDPDSPLNLIPVNETQTPQTEQVEQVETPNRTDGNTAGSTGGGGSGFNSSFTTPTSVTGGTSGSNGQTAQSTGTTGGATGGATGGSQAGGSAGGTTGGATGGSQAGGSAGGAATGGDTASGGSAAGAAGAEGGGGSAGGQAGGGTAGGEVSGNPLDNVDFANILGNVFENDPFFNDFAADIEATVGDLAADIAANGGMNQELQDRLDAVGMDLNELQDAVGNSVAGLDAAVGNNADAINNLQQDVDNRFDQTDDTLSDIASEVAANGQVSAENAEKLNELGVSLGELENQFGESVNGLSEAIEGTAQNVRDLADATSEGLSKAAQERQELAQGIAANGELSAENAEKLNELGVSVGDLRKEFGESVSGLGEAIDNTNEAVLGLADATSEGFSQAAQERQELAQGIAANGELTAENANKLNELGVSVGDLRKEFGESVTGLGEAIDNTNEAVLGLADATSEGFSQAAQERQELAQNIAANGEMTAENANKLNELGVNVNDLRNEFGESITGLGQAIDNTNQSVLDLAGATEQGFANVDARIDETANELAQGIAANGEMTAENAQAINDLGLTFDEFATQYAQDVEGFNEAIGNTNQNVIDLATATSDAFGQVGERFGEVETAMGEGFDQAASERQGLGEDIAGVGTAVGTGIGALTGLMGGYDKLNALRAKNAARERFKPTEQGLFDYTTIANYQARPLQQVQIGTGRGLFS